MSPSRGSGAHSKASECVTVKSEASASLPRLGRDRSTSGLQLVLLALSLLIWYRTDLLRNVQRLCQEYTRLGLPVLHQLGPYSPWHGGTYKPWPVGCVITQVHILQRHGARFPTTEAGIRIQRSLEKLQQAQNYLDDRLSFLEDFQYDLGIDELTDFGREECVNCTLTKGASSHPSRARASARVAQSRYNHLFSDDATPAWLRASICARVVESAQIWRNEIERRLDGVLLEGPLVIEDKPGVRLRFLDRRRHSSAAQSNNTLSTHMCTNSNSSLALRAFHEWEREYGDGIASRLNTIAPGANLQASDIPQLISLCGFHSVAINGVSPFCAIFSKKEYAAFERLVSAIKFYANGPGNKLGPVQGVGYVNELIARLRQRELIDDTQTNHSHPFPLARPLYVDFTHDTLLVSAISALDMASRDVSHFRAGDVCPFGGRLVTERADCSLSHTLEPSQQSVRLLLNDRELKRWEAVDLFVEEQVYAREMGQGDWDRCIADTGQHQGVQYETIIS